MTYNPTQFKKLDIPHLAAIPVSPVRRRQTTPGRILHLS
jgi:hypothetical protein